jgi:hypothetical protein
MIFVDCYADSQIIPYKKTRDQLFLFYGSKSTIIEKNWDEVDKVDTITSVLRRKMRIVTKDPSSTSTDFAYIVTLAPTSAVTYKSPKAASTKSIISFYRLV